MSFPDLALPFVPDIDADLRSAVEAAGVSIERLQAAMTAGEDLAEPAADLAACQFKLKTALGRAMQ